MYICRHFAKKLTAFCILTENKEHENKIYKLSKWQ